MEYPGLAYRKPLTHRIHHRSISELESSVLHATSAKEFITVIRDALEASISAWMKLKCMHRDITPDAITISDTRRSDDMGHGCLGNWDQARKGHVEREEEANPERQGTWQFASVGILREPKKAHEIHDDLQSIFWVAMYTAAHKFPHDRNKEFNPNMFDEINDTSTDHPSRYRGGRDKLDWLKRREMVPFFKLPVVHGLLNKQRQFWAKYETLRENHEDKAFRALHDAIESNPAPYFLPMFNEALADNSAWRDGAPTDDQYP
ncbi:hypothetical protein K474DRAFT_1709256 [Panus rudis PR-1116 ss-1]|nr:hypothetical protein K474DRAFT_1709256 [Panus rudis PR-1116 ss-1]